MSDPQIKMDSFRVLNLRKKIDICSFKATAFTKRRTVLLLQLYYSSTHVMKFTVAYVRKFRTSTTQRDCNRR